MAERILSREEGGLLRSLIDRLPRKEQAQAETQPQPAPRILTGHQFRVLSVAVLPDGRRALSGGDDKTARLWDLETGTELHRFDDRFEIFSVAALPDGRRALLGCGYHIVLWDVEAWIGLRRWDAHSTKVWSVAALPDEQRGLSGSADNTMSLWDLNTGAELRRFVGQSPRINSVAALPDGRRVLSGGGTDLPFDQDTTMRLWDLETGAELRRFVGHSRRVHSVVALPDRRRALSGSDDGTIRLWDLETGAVLRTFRTPVSSLAVLPDGRRALSGGYDAAMRLWDLDTGAELRRFEGHTGTVSSVAVMPDGRRAISGSWDKTLRLWDIEPIAEDAGYTTARIALLGDSGVGKTGLGWRIAHGAFREHSSTHGQQFWVIDQLGRTREDGTQCEAVLWDLAGQPDYRLIHALFLDQADLGLLLFDPTNRERPLAGVEYWLRHLRAATGRAIAAGESSATAGAPTLLVAARADRGTPTLTAVEIEAFCNRQEISG